MIIKEIELDDLSKSEYFHLLKTLVEYFYVQFGEDLEIVQGEEKKIPEKLIPTSLKGIDNLDEKIEIAHIDTISVIETVNHVIDYLKSKGDE